MFQDILVLLSKGLWTPTSGYLWVDGVSRSKGMLSPEAEPISQQKVARFSDTSPRQSAGGPWALGLAGRQVPEPGKCDRELDGCPVQQVSGEEGGAVPYVVL